MPLILPDDEHNRRLLASVHPKGWINPEPAGRYNLVVIGAGTAGLVAAAGAAALGARVALVERDLMGGDCLNVGCVPSKALLSASRVAATVRRAEEFGVRVPGGVSVDFAAVMQRLRRLRADIAPHDSTERFRGLGVDVFLGEGRFTSAQQVEVEGRTLSFSRALIATGTRAARPGIPGLEEAGFHTNESVFTLCELPRRLAVIGAGPIGCELAQAFVRFGSQVTIIETAAAILSREDEEAATSVSRALLREGVMLQLNSQVTRVEPGVEKTLIIRSDGAERPLIADQILVAVGRVPNTEGLNLEAASIEQDGAGIRVNDFLQTTNPSVYAAGDVCSAQKFTHAADAMARIVIQNALFFGRKRQSTLLIPRCTYTSPELAQVGLTEQDADERRIRIDTFRQPMSEVDRALLDGAGEGFVKVHVQRGTDRILGATIVSEHAGEMISEMTLAMTAGLGLKAIGRSVHPYPTRAEALRKIADGWSRTRLTPTVRSLFRHWLEFRR